MAKAKEKIFEVACPDCGAMLRIDAATGVLVSHTSAPRKRMFEDLETAAKAMREQNERKESIFRQSVEGRRTKRTCSRRNLPKPCARPRTLPKASRCASSTLIEFRISNINMGGMVIGHGAHIGETLKTPLALPRWPRY